MKVRADLFTGILPFVRVAEEKSFARAAASLGLTTAAVSKAVKKLEEDLEVKLLERTSRVVSLTREGEEFLARCEPAVLGVQSARAAMEGARREPRGTLAVTLPFILAPLVIPGLTRLAALHPRLAFRFDVSDRVARVSGESYDVALRLGELEDSTLVAKLLLRTRWVTVASPAYLARRGTPRRIEDLASHNALRFVAPNGKVRNWSFRRGERDESFVASGNLLIDHGVHLVTAAEAGMGIAQVLDFMVGPALAAGALVEVLAGSSAKGPHVHALSTAARASSANVRAFVAYLGEVLRAPS